MVSGIKSGLAIGQMAAKEASIRQLSRDDAASLKKSSKEFEAIFVEIMLKSMRDSIPDSGFMDGGNGEKIFQSMLDSEYSRILASKQSSGLAKSIEQQLLNASEGLRTSMQQNVGVGSYRTSRD